MYLRPWSFKPVTDITGWYFFPVILFLLFPDKSSYSASINWSIGNALMKPITNYKWQEQDYRKKMSACNVSYRLKRSGPIVEHICRWIIFKGILNLGSGYLICILFYTAECICEIWFVWVNSNMIRNLLGTLWQYFTYLMYEYCLDLYYGNAIL